MRWKLSLPETAGVSFVGLALGFGAAKLASSVKGKSHGAAMVLTGALLYLLGVVIGANRPAAGYLVDKSAA